MTEAVHNILLRKTEKDYLKLPDCKWLQNYMKNVVQSNLPALLTPTAAQARRKNMCRNNFASEGRVPLRRKQFPYTIPFLVPLWFRISA